MLDEPRACPLSPVVTTLDQMSNQASFEPIFHVYHGFDRKPAEVQLEDGTWCDAEIRMWARDGAGHWTAHVMWSRGPGQGQYLGNFPADRLRAMPNISE